MWIMPESKISFIWRLKLGVRAPQGSVYYSASYRKLIYKKTNIIMLRTWSVKLQLSYIYIRKVIVKIITLWWNNFQYLLSLPILVYWHPMSIVYRLWNYIGIITITEVLVILYQYTSNIYTSITESDFFIRYSKSTDHFRQCPWIFLHRIVWHFGAGPWHPSLKE